MQKRCKSPYVRVPGTKKCSKNPKVKAMVECRKKKVKKVLEEFKNEMLRDSHGNTVSSRSQAIAIALKEAEKYCL